MNRFTDRLSPKAKQWLWFVGLYFGGLAAVALVASIIRLMMIPMMK